MYINCFFKHLEHSTDLLLPLQTCPQTWHTQFIHIDSIWSGMRTICWLTISHVSIMYATEEGKKKVKKDGKVWSEWDRSCAALASWPQGVSWLFEWTSLCLMLSYRGQTEVWALYSSGIELSAFLTRSSNLFFLPPTLFAARPLHCLSSSFDSCRQRQVFVLTHIEKTINRHSDQIF